MHPYELSIYLGTALTLLGRLPGWHKALHVRGKKLVWIKWLFLLGAIFLGIGSYLDNNPIFTGLEIIVVLASATAFIPERILTTSRRTVVCTVAGIFAFVFSVWMIQQGAPWFWWNWFGVVGILFTIPGFSFVGFSRYSDAFFIGSGIFLSLNAAMFFTLGFSHIALNFLVLNVIFGTKSFKDFQAT